MDSSPLPPVSPIEAVSFQREQRERPVNDRRTPRPRPQSARVLPIIGELTIAEFRMKYSRVRSRIVDPRIGKRRYKRLPLAEATGSPLNAAMSSCSCERSARNPTLFHRRGFRARSRRGTPRRCMCIGDHIAFRRRTFSRVNPRGTAQPLLRRKSPSRKLRNSDRLKEQFIATIAREGRHPLAPLTSRFVLQAKAPQDLKFAVELLERQSHQVERVLNELLDLAKIQKVRCKSRGGASISRGFSTALSRSPHLFDENNSTSSILSPQRIELEADSARLTQIIAGLLNNASNSRRPGSTHSSSSVSR